MRDGCQGWLKSDVEARAWSFDFTSPWVDCSDAGNAGVEPPTDAWDVADYIRRNGKDWSLQAFSDWLKAKAAELRQIEETFGRGTVGDGLILVARLLIRRLPDCKSWAEVDSFVRELHDQEQMEMPGDVFAIIRNIIRANQGKPDPTTAMGAAAVLFIHGVTNGASIDSMNAGYKDGLGGTFR